jgi:parallel beta-helix repeat protein
MIALKKCGSIILSCLFLMSVFCFLRINPARADSIVIHVPSVEYPTIQDAIDSSVPNTIILVANGTYREHLNILQSLSIIGENRDATIIDGADANIVISIGANNVVIDSLTVTKSVPQTFDTGISMDRARGVTVNNSKITNIYTGFSFYSSSNNYISNNAIYNNTSGSVLLYSNNNSFSNNVFSENAQGILVTYSSLNVVAGNTFTNNSASVVLASTSNRNYFFHNNIEDDVQVSFGSYNTWSRENEGNYWINYNRTGRDMNNDGIGDEPYRMDDANLDNYPLMGTYTEHYVISGNAAFRIAIISNSTISGMKFEIGMETGNKIISFNVTGIDGAEGFCRIKIPNTLMGPPFVVTGSTVSVPVYLLASSNATNSSLYFSYPSEETAISVVYSRELELYEKLLDEYTKLETEMVGLNSTYQGVLANYTVDYQTLLNKFNILLANFTSLQNSFVSLDSSLRQSLQNQSESTQNFRNFTYVFAALTAAFLITTVYLSSRLYRSKKPKSYSNEEETFANP